MSLCVCVCAVTLPPIHQQQVAGTKNPTSRTQRPSRARWVHRDGRTDSSSQATDTCSPPPIPETHHTHPLTHQAASSPLQSVIFLSVWAVIFQVALVMQGATLWWTVFFFFPPFFDRLWNFPRLRNLKGRGEINAGSSDWISERWNSGQNRSRSCCLRCSTAGQLREDTIAEPNAL